MSANKDTLAACATFALILVGGYLPGCFRGVERVFGWFGVRGCNVKIPLDPLGGRSGVLPGPWWENSSWSYAIPTKTVHMTSSAPNEHHLSGQSVRPFIHSLSRVNGKIQLAIFPVVLKAIFIKNKKSNGWEDTFVEFIDYMIPGTLLRIVEEI